MKGSDEESNKTNDPEFNEDLDMEKPVITKGMKFNNAIVFRKALREWQVQGGYDLEFVKNESSRVTVQCKEKCGFRVHASWMQQERTFQLKSIHPKHYCLRTYNNHLVNSKYIAEKYVDKLRDDPYKKVDCFQKEIRRDLVVDVSKWQLYRAKRKARQVIDGDMTEQYNTLRDYLETVMKHNPNCCLQLTVDKPGPDLPPVFSRLYVRYNAQLKSMLQGCRPMIGLDGAFLKGIYGGQLLSAVGRDGNDNMFPIAIAVVEAETKDSWTWFLKLLMEDIGTVEERGWGFISDRQKGLLEVFKEFLPNAEHRYCMRHLYANFRKLFRGKELKDAMWRAASAGTVWEHEADEPPDENKVSRRFRVMSCSKCLKKGHNLRSCKNPIHPNSKLLKKRGHRLR